MDLETKETYGTINRVGLLAALRLYRLVGKLLKKVTVFHVISEAFIC